MLLTYSIFMQHNKTRDYSVTDMAFTFISGISDGRMDMLPGIGKMKKHIVIFCVPVMLVFAGIGAFVSVFPRNGAYIPAAEGLMTVAGRTDYTPRVLHDPLAELGLRGKVLEPDEIQRILNENGYECEVRVTELYFDDLAELKAYVDELKKKYSHLKIKEI